MVKRQTGQPAARRSGCAATRIYQSTSTTAAAPITARSQGRRRCAVRGGRRHERGEGVAALAAGALAERGRAALARRADFGGVQRKRRRGRTRHNLNIGRLKAAGLGEAKPRCEARRPTLRRSVRESGARSIARTTFDARHNACSCSSRSKTAGHLQTRTRPQGICDPPPGATAQAAVKAHQAFARLSLHQPVFCLPAGCRRAVAALPRSARHSRYPFQSRCVNFAEQDNRCRTRQQTPSCHLAEDKVQGPSSSSDPSRARRCAARGATAPSRRHSLPAACASQVHPQHKRPALK